VRLKNSVHKLIRFIELLTIPRARNDNTPRLERRNRDLLTFPQCRTVPLAIAESGAHTDAVLVC